MNFKVLTICIIALTFFSACTTLYIPTAVNVPSLTTEGEISAKASLGLAGTGLANFQAAFSPAEHLGMMGGAMINNSGVDGSLGTQTAYNGTTSYNLSRSDLAYEIGPGYYTQLKGRWHIEVFGGIGGGKVKDNIGTRDSSNYPYSIASYNKLFIQPSIAYLSDYLDMAFTLRISEVMFTNIQSNKPTINDKKFAFPMADPTVTFRGGYKFIKPFVQVGMFIPLGQDYSKINTDLNFININFGICFDINRKWENQ